MKTNESMFVSLYSFILQDNGHILNLCGIKGANIYTHRSVCGYVNVCVFMFMCTFYKGCTVHYYANTYTQTIFFSENKTNCMQCVFIKIKCSLVMFVDDGGGGAFATSLVLHMRNLFYIVVYYMHHCNCCVQ